MATGAIWMVLFRVVERSIGLISTIILARLLIPADFGVVAMAMSIVAAIEIMTAFSLDLALIQKPDADRRHYDAAWTLNVLFGLTNAAVLVLGAAAVASFYREPRVQGVILWLALYVAIQGFANIGVIAFQKELQFHKHFFLGVIKKLCGFAVTISLAFALRSYWALVAGMLATAVCGVVLSYVMHPYRPRFGLSGCRELLHFSWWVLINNILIFVVHRSSDLFIGRHAGPQALGIYNVAYEIANLPTTEMVFPISRAVYPGYSRMASNLSELRRGYLDVLSVILLVVMPAGLGIAALADPLVRVLFGEKWLEAIPLIPVLCMFGIIRAALSNSGSVFLALGEPKATVKVTTLQVALMMIGFWIFVPSGGALAAAYVVVVAVCVQAPLILILLSRRLEFRGFDVIRSAWRPIVCGAVMFSVVSIARTFFESASMGALLQITVLIPLGAIVYLSLLLGLWIAVGRPLGGEVFVLQRVRQATQAFGLSSFRRR
jgi:PST family polysaccharide transporter